MICAARSLALSLSRCMHAPYMGDDVDVFKVRKIVDDEQVSHVDPNIIQQPNISAEKLSRMWATAKAKWNQPYADWKSESGNNQPWLSFCQGKGWVEWGLV